MAVKIQGTMEQKKGGGGIGSLLGKVLGGAAGFMLGGPAGAMQGAALGGKVGGAAGNMVNPAKQQDLGVNVRGAQGPSTPATPMKSNAIDRLNSAIDLGTTVAGAADKIPGLPSAPVGGGPTMPSMPKVGSAFQRRVAGGF